MTAGVVSICYVDFLSVYPYMIDQPSIITKENAAD
jgi:hypothetical protein